MMLESIINVIASYSSTNLFLAIGAFLLMILALNIKQTNPAYANDNISFIRLLRIPRNWFNLPSIFPPKIIIDSNDPEYVDKDELNQDIRKYGFIHDSEHDIFYSAMDAWQRGHGYCKSYDLLSPFINLIFDSEPIYFDYDNRRWLIEFWKGQYGMTTGGEVGVYVSDNESDKDKDPDLIIYKSVSDNELLPMAFILEKNNRVLIERYGRHWWLTGFKLGEFSRPKDLIMNVAIELKDSAMRDAFVESLKKVGYQDDELIINGNRVSLVFNKPHSPRPVTNVKVLTSFVQSINKRNCDKYARMTRNYDNTLDKLNYIRVKYPDMYNRMLHISNRL